MEVNAQIQENQELDLLNSGSQILLLRHANSQYNFAFEQMEEKEYSDEDYKKLRIRKDLRDAPLSELGLQQWTKAQPLANKLKVEHVFISPLKRALETAYNVFSSHPNFENIQFTLLPMLKEAIDTTWDIPMNVLDTIEEYKAKFKNFDVSQIEKYPDQPHWFLKDINQEFSEKIMASKIPDSKDPLSSNAYDLILEEINESYPERIESTNNILSRISKAKNQVREFLETTDIDPDSKVVLVGHSCYFSMWTGKWDREISAYKDSIPPPSESVFLKNCQFYPDNLNFPKIS